jgi:hypothetical protein
MDSPVLFEEVSKSDVLKLSFVNFGINLILGEIGYFLVGLHFTSAHTCYLIGGVCFYSVHEIGHTNLFQFWTKIHVLGHHISSYPPKLFLGETYSENMKDPYFIGTLVYAVPAIVLTALFHVLLSTQNTHSFVVLGYFMIFLLTENYMHKELHLRNSQLAKYLWFRKIRYLHYLHHTRDMKRNFGIKDFSLDWAFGNLVLG